MTAGNYCDRSISTVKYTASILLFWCSMRMCKIVQVYGYLVLIPQFIPDLSMLRISLISKALYISTEVSNTIQE